MVESKFRDNCLQTTKELSHTTPTIGNFGRRMSNFGLSIDILFIDLLVKYLKREVDGTW